jgi:DNA-binding MarR family transcriptional regulator
MNYDLYQQFLLQLQDCSLAIHRTFEKELSWGDITPRQIDVLRLLINGNSHLISDISLQTKTSDQETASLIRQLQLLGFVKNTSSFVTCTELGQRMCEVILQRYKQIARAILREYSAELLETHLDFMRTLQHKIVNTDFHRK